jgi:hypothetical protein
MTSAGQWYRRLNGHRTAKMSEFNDEVVGVGYMVSTAAVSDATSHRSALRTWQHQESSSLSCCSQLRPKVWRRDPLDIQSIHIVHVDVEEET